MVTRSTVMYQAYLLHRSPYSNTSLLLECFTSEHGRFPVIAKGVKGSRGQGNSILQPFNQLLIKVAGKGEVKTLAGYEQDNDCVELHGKSMYCGFYLNELLVRILARNDPHPTLFTVYKSTLARLSTDENPEPALRLFEVALLQELGYGLLLDADIDSGQSIIADAYYSFELENGFRKSQQTSHSISGTTILALSGKTPFGEIEREESRRLMRGILEHYLGNKPLKSRELFMRTFT